MTKEELENYYFSHTVEHTAERLGVSVRTLYNYLKEQNIKLKGNTGKRKIKID
jgi:predicted site-specific integrase-resolvase